jgi:predicted glycosyltransferase
MASNSDTDVVWVKNYQGHRPYLKGTKNGRLLFNDDYKPRLGEIYFSHKEQEVIDKIDKDYIVVEPNVKRVYAHTVNKAWDKWEELFKHDLPWLQLGDVTVKRYTKWKETNTFREALQILSKAKLFVGTDGGLHHAAAALGIPSVVIWTGFTSPRHLGYDTHTNIHDGSDPCGTYTSVCEHCLLKAKAITVEQVREAVISEFESSSMARQLQTP